MDFGVSSCSETRVHGATRIAADAQREKLAAIESSDPGFRTAVAEAFLAGYRVGQLTAVYLAVLGALTSALSIQNRDIKRA
jgi:hypothetical protein